MSKVSRISIVVILVLVGGALVALLQLGRPIHTDLSVVGQGRPTLVLAYENFSPAGVDALERLRAVRPDYEDRIEFVVADLGTPDGRAFAIRHNLRDGTAVFLAPNGQPVRVTGIPADERALRQQLDLKLAQVGLRE
jgi:hypothetical protein